MKRLLYLLVLIMQGGFINAQNAEFFKEETDLKIENGYLIVEGTYFLSNTKDEMLSASHFYHIPHDSSIYGAAEAISVKEMKQSAPVSFVQNDSGIVFNVSAKPYSISKYKVVYRQKLLADKAEYILVSSREWGKPFETVKYTLTVPRDMEIVSISYPDDGISYTKIIKTYHWVMYDFMPNKNLEIVFKKQTQ